MAADRDPPTAADVAVTAASPALVMLMVGSLVFFLVEVLYAGRYSDRLLYTLFFFVFGAVLVARIAIQYDAARATLYGVGLGGVTFLALMAYVEYPAGTPFQSVRWLVNLGLMLLIWWSAHKLTWDCTHIDENRDSSGRGLLSAAGLGDEPADEEPAPPAPEPTGKKKKKKGPGAFAVWVNGWRAALAARRERPHTPGVWVIYFALAALPLFAVGQSLIPSDDADRRRATFLQMAVYVGSALGLLVTTSLLGLRRYLRQRKAKPPAALTAGWLGLGAGLIVVFLALGAFLPRPHSEVPWFGLPRAGTGDRDASRYAQLGDSAGKGDGADGNVSEKGAGNAAGKGGDPGGGKGTQGAGKGDDGQGGGGKEGKGAGKGESGSKGEARGKTEGAKGKDDGAGGKTEREGGESKGNSGQRNAGSGSPPQVSESVQKVAEIAKWIVLAVVVFLVLAGLVLAVLKYLAPFTGWAQRWLDAVRAWWANLFGKKSGATRAAEEAAREVGPVRPPPFSAYSDPFATGTADGRDAAELVEYTFAALDSWAWDRGHGRRAAETPLEFAARLADEFPDHAADYRRLAGAYARVAYAEGSPPAGTLKLLEAVWDRMVHGTTAAAEVE